MLKFKELLINTYIFLNKIFLKILVCHCEEIIRVLCCVHTVHGCVALAPSCGHCPTWHVATSCKAAGWDRRKQRPAVLVFFSRWAVGLINLSLNMPVSKPYMINTMQELLFYGLERKTCTETPVGDSGPSEFTLALMTSLVSIVG